MKIVFTPNAYLAAEKWLFHYHFKQITVEEIVSGVLGAAVRTMENPNDPDAWQWKLPEDQLKGGI